MFKTIVVGCDGSAHGLAAARFAASLARRFGSRLIVAGAYVHTPHVRMDGSALEKLAREDAEQGAQAGVAAAAGTADVRMVVASGSTPAAALHDVARAERADLLVVGTSERRRIAGTQPGSVTEHVLHHSPCPVAIVPPADEPPAFRRIGVAVDDSAPARRALSTALSLAAVLGDDVEELVLLHAEPGESVHAGMRAPGVPVRRPTPEWLRALPHEVDTPVPVRVRTEAGGAAGIVAAGTEELDLLVMGSRDQSAVSRLVLGSVSRYVVRNAQHPVIVVFRREAAEAGDASAPGLASAHR